MVTLRGGYSSSRTTRAEMKRAAQHETMRKFMEAPDVKQVLSKLAATGKTGAEKDWRACCVTLAQKGEDGVALAVDSAWARLSRSDDPEARFSAGMAFDEHYKALFLVNPKRAEAFVRSHFFAEKDLEMKAVLVRYMPEDMRARLTPRHAAPAFTAA